MKNVKEFLKTDRNKAIAKFGTGLVFMLIVVLLLAASSFNTPMTETTNEPEETKSEVKSIEEIANDLINTDYTYFFKKASLSNNDIELYNGNVTSGVDSGYYEGSNEVYKYSCTVDNCVKVFANHEEAFEMQKDNYFDLKYIFDYIKTLNNENTFDKDKTIHTYSNNEQNITITIEEDGTSITNIVINDSENEYTLTFKLNI